VADAELALGQLPADPAPGARADSEIDQYIARRHEQRETQAEDQFGNLICDRYDLDEEWLALRREHERQQQSTRLEQWRDHHMRQARNLSRTLSSMVRFHLEQAQRLEGRR
jgi:hypothetical protein